MRISRMARYVHYITVQLELPVGFFVLSLLEATYVVPPLTRLNVTVGR